MNSIQLFVFVAVLICGVCSYTYIIPPEMGKSPDHEGFCFHSESNSLIKTGESIILKKCEQVSCGNDYTIGVYGCGTFHIEDPSCKKFERDYSKPYPVCCQEFICVEFADKVVDDNEKHLNKNTID